jgi:hypothetical protein
MPTKRPRLMLSVPDEVLHDLRTLAFASRKPVSTVVVELLTDMRPQILGIAREIAGISVDRKRSAEIQRLIEASPEGKQHGFRFTETVRVIGVRAPAPRRRRRSGATKK